MKKTFLVFAAVMLLACVSIQPRGLAYGQRIDFKYDVIVQDDLTGDYLTFNSRSGDYKFVRCSDEASVTGRGIIKRDGCMVSLSHVLETHKVLATVDECGLQSKASVEVFEASKFLTEMKEVLNDTYMRDNTAGCDKTIKK